MGAACLLGHGNDRGRPGNDAGDAVGWPGDWRDRRMTGMERLVSGFRLVEGPVYEAESDSLVFSDVFGGGVYRLRPDGSYETLVQRRRGVGGIVPHAAGGYVIGGRNLA